jgi:hypothetical protein
VLREDQRFRNIVDRRREALGLAKPPEGTD